MGRKVAFIHVEAVTKRYSVKKVFLEISQNPQERVQSLFFNKVSGLQLYWKRDSGTGAVLWILQNF